MKYRVTGTIKVEQQFEVVVEANDKEDAEIRLESWAIPDFDQANQLLHGLFEDGDLKIDLDEVEEESGGEDD